jgi:deoxyribodipyrimidine photo-lyase
MLEKRIQKLNDRPYEGNLVVYWMSRDQRVQDNHALSYAQKLALEKKEPLVVVFCLQENFLGAQTRQFQFMVEGLRKVFQELQKLKIPFVVLEGSPQQVLSRFVKKYKVGAVVTDFSPLKIKQVWLDQLLGIVDIPVIEIDAHNIVPAKYVADKKIYSAFLMKKKIYPILEEFLEEEIPKLKPNHNIVERVQQEIVRTQNFLAQFPRYNNYVDSEEVLKIFREKKLDNYDQARNDPNLEGQSGLSPYLHFGNIYAGKVACVVRSKQNPQNIESVKSFLNELIIWRELAENFCLYEPNYDNWEGLPNWGRKTLEEHLGDVREYVYSLENLEQSKTHDDLWNASQMQMVKTGKMHGYMRMYWAKKILEWTLHPKEAIEIAVYLNDKYSLDGRDPNGYAGIAWSIGGVHDRPWFGKSIFGKIRYMSRGGCERKFDVAKYIKNQL